MTHSTVAEVLFMGMEGETSGLEVLTTVQSMENLDEYAALQRACEILEYLTAHATDRCVAGGSCNPEIHFRDLAP